MGSIPDPGPITPAPKPEQGFDISQLIRSPKKDQQNQRIPQLMPPQQQQPMLDLSALLNF